MKKFLKKLLRVGLLVALFCGCLVISHGFDIYRHWELSLSRQKGPSDWVKNPPDLHVNDVLDKRKSVNNTFQADGEKVRSNQSTVSVLGTTDRCRWVEPWFAKKAWKQVQLIFYGKPIMQVVKRLCVQRHWKMMIISNDSNTNSLNELKRRVSIDDTFTIMFTSSRQYHLPIIQQLANSPNALVSSIRYAFKTTGPKKEQLLSFRQHFDAYGCSLDEAGIMPLSFLIDDSQDCVRFFKYANLNPSSWWVLKSSQGYGGEGITIHQNMSLLYKKFGTCKRNGEYVVQEYLSNLLLVENRKFDVRGLVLIAGTNPYFLFYHEGYLRVSVSDFTLKGDRNVHITNSHLQVTSRNFDPEKHFWSFGRFQEFLNANHPDNNNFVENKLIPFIKNASLFLLQTSKCRVRTLALYCLACLQVSW